MRPVAVRARQRGQVFPLVLGLALLVLAGAGFLFTLGRVHLAKSQAQTAADIAALSAGRALLADLAQAAVAGPVASARWRSRLAAEAVRAAGPAGARVDRLAFPGPSWPPVAVEVTVSRPGPRGSRVSATARAGLAPPAGVPAPGGARGRGGGYSGPLVHRDGRPMCPAVGAAFDLMDAAARADGVDLVVVSGFRSDAEQALLFARHPDPRWVAPPGRSRHRDATELDLSLSGGAGQWLPRNAARFGFVQRYSWEPWHWGYLPGCGTAAAAMPGTAGSGSVLTGVPAWVPAHYRGLVASAAAQTGVAPALLAALLRSESGFDARAVSPAGARGIAQFMPATARGVGLADPFDPAQAIPAAARLLAGHIRSFGSVPLALAAYNAGPGAVQRYGGVPPYAETRAYVARIMALAGGAGALFDAPGGGVVLLRAGESLV